MEPVRCAFHRKADKKIDSEVAWFGSGMDNHSVSSWAVPDAVLIVVRSDVMFAIAVAAVTAVYFAGATLKRRAVEPALPWRASVVGGAQDEVRAITHSVGREWKAPLSGERADHIENSQQHRARHAVTLVTVAVLGLAGALALTLSGHPPSPYISMAPALVASTLAIVVAVHISRQMKTRSILISRGSRLLASSLFVEASSAAAMVVAVSVVVHTAGLTAVSFVEVVAIICGARLAVGLTPWPGGLVVADAVFLIPLIWIGVPPHVGLAAVLIWRAGSFLAATAALAMASLTDFLPSQALETFEGKSGRFAHRALFGTLSVLPGGLRNRVRSKVFDTMFALSDDPWSYQESGYERRKRETLISAVIAESRLIVEVGCADGHNVVALAEEFPKATIIGVDVSATAVAIATRRTQHMENVQIVQTKNGLPHEIQAHEQIDCVILSEILYYLGTERAIRQALYPFRSRMSPDCRVILLHGSSDADSLHDRAIRALNLSVESSHLVADDERPYVMTIAR